MAHKVRVHIKSLPFQPRGNAGMYRAGSAQVLDAEEAYELEKAGIAIVVEDPAHNEADHISARIEEEPKAPADEKSESDEADGADGDEESFEDDESEKEGDEDSE